MDLSTSYLGLELPHPFMPGASPLVDDLDTVRRLEDAGAAAIVLRSLFEEQIDGDRRATRRFLGSHEESFAEALSFFPSPDDFALGPDEYLEQLRRIKSAVDVPVIASLNGVSEGGWLSYARLMEEAGADALELNFYLLATDPTESAQAVETRILDMVRKLKAEIRIPLALKLSPFFSALAHFAAEVDAAGADGLVLFNRFYQADIDPENLELTRTLSLSSPGELLLRLRWLAILSALETRLTFAASGGVHDALGAIKAVMAGASAVQLVSALLRNGPGHLARVREDVVRWLEENEYDSLEQMRGSMNLARVPDPTAYERANYMYILQTWRV
jgi:dihydroorotate dehydrogenase (fumarate)